MYVLSNSPKYTCKSCRNKIEPDTLEEIFHEQLKNFVVSEDLVSQELSKYDSSIKDKERLLCKMEDEQKKVTRKIDELMELFYAGEIPKKGFSSFYDPLEEQREEIGKGIPELQAEIDFMKTQLLSSDQMISDARDLYQKWPKLERLQKRSIIENITSKIVIHDKSISINLIQITDPLHTSSELTTKGQHTNRGS
jgi:site-specific DNA recombinase